MPLKLYKKPRIAKNCTKGQQLSGQAKSNLKGQVSDFNLKKATVVTLCGQEKI